MHLESATARLPDGARAVFVLSAPSRLALHLCAAVSLAVAPFEMSFAGVFGPPHITVSELRSPMPGGMLAVEATHHDQTASLTVVSRAEGMRDGKRVSFPLRLVRTGEGTYRIAKQWQTGTPWLLVLAAEDGPGGAHAVAEAFVKIDATGKVSGIEYPAPGWVDKTNTPKRTAAREIDVILAGMAGKP